jgi:hypothetical protein
VAFLLASIRWWESSLWRNSRLKAFSSIRQGVFLNSEVVDLHQPRILVPRLSIMRLRVFARTGLIYGDDAKVFTCIKMVVFRTDPRFHFSGMEVFHAHWEVLMRLGSADAPGGLDGKDESG